MADPITLSGIWTWRRLLGRLLAAALGSAVAGAALPCQADPQTNRIVIDYVKPIDPAHQRLYEMLQEKHALEKLQQIFSPIRLPRDLTLRTVGCNGRVNAWYFQQVVSVCYEYLANIHKMVPTSPTAKVTPTDAVLGQFFYVFAHEIGHAAFDLLNIPLFGRLEDSADQFATYVMLQFGPSDARRLITGAAYAYKHFVNDPKRTEPLKMLSDAHSTPEQRFYNLLCIAYGADTDLFADFVTDGYLPETRAQGCKQEYGELNYAFHTLINPHLDQQMALAVMQREWLPPPTKQMQLSGR